VGEHSQKRKGKTNQKQTPDHFQLKKHKKKKRKIKKKGKGGGGENFYATRETKKT